MKLKQLSLFLQNEPGALTTPCRLLAVAGINIITLSLADTHQFGILRLIVRDPDKAKEVLERSGLLVKVTEVVAIEVDDRPGGLSELLEAVGATRVNVDYVYAFTHKRSSRGVLVFRFSDPDLAIRALTGSAARVLDAQELFAQMGE